MKIFDRLFYIFSLLLFTFMVFIIDFHTITILLTRLFEFRTLFIATLTICVNIFFIRCIMDCVRSHRIRKNEKIKIGDKVKYQYNDGVYYRTAILDIVDKCKDGYVIENENIRVKVSREYILKNRIDK